MNHKRRRPKHQRAGCLMCKPHKDERVGPMNGARRKQRVEAERAREINA